MADGVKPETVGEAIDALLQATRLELTAAWESTFGCPSPRGSRVELLRQALAWTLQMDAAGKKWRRQRALQSVSSTPAAPGTRLIREWQGKTHQVTIVPEGFEYQGKVYRSLSLVARHITGTRWSGPKFFGLR